MNAKIYGWEVGMKVFVVVTINPRNTDAREETVTKVGRKWVTFGEGYREDRFDPETMLIDGKGYSSPGRVYASEAEYLDSTEREKMWSNFRSKLDYRAPKHLTTERLREIIAEVLPPLTPATDHAGGR